MKKYVVYFFMAVFVLVVSPISVLGATEYDSPVSVQIGEIQKDQPAPPVDVYKPAPPKDGGGRLPQTGEMIQTLIFLLTGVSLVLITIGIMVMKQIFGKDLDTFEEVVPL